MHILDNKLKQAVKYISNKNNKKKNHLRGIKDEMLELRTKLERF